MTDSFSTVSCRTEGSCIFLLHGKCAVGPVGTPLRGVRRDRVRWMRTPQRGVPTGCVAHFPKSRGIATPACALVRDDGCFEAHKKRRAQRRPHIGRDTLQSGSFPALLRQKSTAGVSLAVLFVLVLQKNLSLWSAKQFWVRVFCSQPQPQSAEILDVSQGRGLRLWGKRSSQNRIHPYVRPPKGGRLRF